jgi:hypothetical protein
MIRVGLTLHLLDFDGLVEKMRAYPPLANAEFYIAGINCGAFTVDTMAEVSSLAAEMSGVSQKFQDAATEYESWGRTATVHAIK